MRVVRFAMALGSAAMIALAFGGPVTASAETLPANASDVIEFTGNAAAAVNWESNSGPYTFGGSTCLPIYSDGDVGAVPETVATGYSCAIGLSGGTFQNIACGTGSAAGSAGTTITESGPDGGDTLTLGAYSIQFVAGVGILTSSGNDTGPSGSGNELVVGVVQIAPVGLNPLSFPSGQCVTGFSVTGIAAAIDESVV